MADVPIILELIHDLAAYENCTSLVAATESSLESTLSFADDNESNSDNINISTPNSSLIQPQTNGSSNTKNDITHFTPGYARTLLAFTPTTPPKAAGMALHFNNYSTWRSCPGIYLEDLFVRSEFRGRGYGKALVMALAAEVVAIKGARLEWSCLKWNESSLKFYAKLGAKQMSDWVGLRVEGEALEKLAKDGKGLVQKGSTAEIKN